MASKRTNIPHQPGAIAASTWSSPSGQKPQDIVDGYVVGKDNTTGQAIVTDGASQLKGITQGEVSIYQFAAFTRPESGEGGRLGRIQATGENFSALDTPALTQNITSLKAVQGCGTGFGSGGREDPEPYIDEPGLPSEPPEEPEADDAPASLGDIANSNPSNPQPNPSEESTGEGCTTTSDCQWYDATSLDQPCPYGTTKKGATEITPGVFMILCCGEERPVGDGCPVDSSQLGWTCTNGTCTQTQGGQFATEEECLASGCQKQTWTCTPNGCVELLDGSGEFDSLEECQLQCSGLGWDCVNGTCQQVSGGRFATQALCEASGCGAGSASPENDYCDGNAGAVLNWSSGSAESFNPPISYVLSSRLLRVDGVDITASKDINLSNPYTVSGQSNLYQVIVSFSSGYIAHHLVESTYPPTLINFEEGTVFGSETRLTGDPSPVSCEGSLSGTNTQTFPPEGRYWAKCEVNKSTGNEQIFSFVAITSTISITQTQVIPCSTDCELIVNYDDGTNENTGAVACDATIEVINNTVTVSDSTGIISSQSYAIEPTAFTYSCRN